MVLKKQHMPGEDLPLPCQTTGLPDETQGAQLSLNFRQGTSNNLVHMSDQILQGKLNSS